MTESFKYTGHGPAKPLTEEDMQRDEHGFTHPNLHTRNGEDTQSASGNLGVYDRLHAYYTDQGYQHDEESTTCEIP